MSDDIKFLKYKTKILAVNTGDKDDRLGKTIIVKHFRGFPDGFTLTPDMTLREIVEREFNTEPQKPKVTIRKAGSGSGIIVPDAGTYEVEYDGTFNFTSATAASGSVLESIKIGSETKTAPFTLDHIIEDVEIVVTFNESQGFNITGAVDGEHGTISPTSAGTYPEGSNVEAKTFTATPETGYVVDTWSVNGTEQAGEEGLTFTLPAITGIDKNYEVKVKFVAGYKVEGGVVDNIGGTVAPDVRYFKPHSRAVMGFTATPADGYQVECWYIDNDRVPNTTVNQTFTDTDIKANHVVRVKFEEIQEDTYKVIVVNNTDPTKVNPGIIEPTAGTQTIPVGTASSVKATPFAGFKIKTFDVTYNGTTTHETITDPTQAHTYSIAHTAKDDETTVTVEFEEIKEVMYNAFVQRTREDYRDPIVPALDNLTLGDAITVNPDDLKSNGFVLTIPQPNAERLVVPALIYPKATGLPTSIKEGNVTETISAWTNGSTITIDGIEYYMTYTNSTITSTATSFNFYW